MARQYEGRSSLITNVGEWCAPSLVYCWASPIDGSAQIGSPDLDGHGVHMKFSLTSNAYSNAMIEGIKRTNMAAPENAEPMSFLADPGGYTVRIPGRAELYGGRGKWVVEAWVSEDPHPVVPQWFWLTTRYPGLQPLSVPDWHTHVKLIAGQLNVNGIAIAPGVKVPIGICGSVTASGLVKTGLRI